MARMGRVLAGGALLATVMACKPFWTAGTVPVLTPLGPHVVVSWPAADPGDEGQSIASYTVWVGGAEVAEVPGTATECVLVGLAASTTYDIEVTAADTAAEVSTGVGGTAITGVIEGSYLTPAGTGGGAAMDCVDTADVDEDRLPDALETGTGTFADAGDTGTDPLSWDSDGDYIGDGDEVLGTAAGLDLPAFGVSPLRADILLEYDWFDDNRDPGTCGAHSHRPTPAIAARVAETFASSPRVNPDGSTGINVVQDYGQDAVHTGGALVVDADGVIAGGVDGTQFLAYKAANLAPERQGFFHWVLLPHRYNSTSDSSGQAELPGDDMIVSLQCYGTTANVGNTVVHELGHNLFLRHGGDEDTNYMPNYNSVMNYWYQFPGVDTGCDAAGDGVAGYSTGGRAALDEGALLEAAGVCGGVALDWNGNTVLDLAPVAVDVNGDSSLTVLTDHDDWGNLELYGAFASPDGAPVAPRDQAEREIITEEPVPPHARQVP